MAQISKGCLLQQHSALKRQLSICIVIVITCHGHLATSYRIVREGRGAGEDASECDVPPCRAGGGGGAGEEASECDVPPCRARGQERRPLSVTYRHVGPAAGVPRLGDAVHQLAADAEVAELDVAAPVQQDVGGLHVPVDDLQLLLQVVERLHRLPGRGG